MLWALFLHQFFCFWHKNDITMDEKKGRYNREKLLQITTHIGIAIDHITSPMRAMICFPKRKWEPTPIKCTENMDQSSINTGSICDKNWYHFKQKASRMLQVHNIIFDIRTKYPIVSGGRWTRHIFSRYSLSQNPLIGSITKPQPH